MSARQSVDMQLVEQLMAMGDWQSLAWRLDNLYWITNKQGKAQKFVMNDEQRNFIDNIWHRNLILKARQKGFSTLLQVLQCDQALFNHDHTGVTIADTLPNAGKLFAKVEYAYDHLPDAIKAACPPESRNKGSGITFGHISPEDGTPHPSTISVGVSARGGTVQLLHVSEMGKISLKFPARASEIVSGAFEAVPEDGCIVVESTAEGAFGEFWELCEPALKRKAEGKPETKLDWRLHFYPWFGSKEYRLSDEDTALVEITPAKRAYFDKLQAELGITIDANQRAWYAKKEETQGKKMKQEYPSTPAEAFEQAIEGAVYGDQMTYLREQGRLGIVPLDPNYPVNTFWDFGLNDANTIWFHQHIGVQHRWIYYIEGNGKDLRHWWHDVCEAHRLKHKYKWGRHFLPHDADAEILGEVITTKRRILESLGMRRAVVVPRVATIGQGIELTRRALAGNHWFDKRTPDPDKGEDMGCGNGIRCLDGYQFEWDDKRGVWSAHPLHNWASHGADGWRQFAQGYTQASSEADTASAFSGFSNRPRSWR